MEIATLRILPVSLRACHWLAAGADLELKVFVLLK
jgi:hypothetical protein